MKSQSFAVVALLVFSGSVYAGDLIPPSWNRGMEGTTFQEWSFSPPEVSIPWVADAGYGNPYGEPAAFPAGSEPGSWASEYDGREGVWVSSEAPYSGMLQINIPNSPDSTPSTELYLQVVSWGASSLVDPVIGGGLAGEISLTDSYSVDGDWWYHRWHIEIEPSPTSESLQLRSSSPFGQLHIDHIVVDTMAVPEPSTLALLGVGLLGLVRRRR